MFGFIGTCILGMVGKSISKYEIRLTCGQGGLHSCGGLAHEELNGDPRDKQSLSLGQAKPRKLHLRLHLLPNVSK